MHAHRGAVAHTPACVCRRVILPLCAQYNILKMSGRACRPDATDHTHSLIHASKQEAVRGLNILGSDLLRGLRQLLPDINKMPRHQQNGAAYASMLGTE